MEEACPQMTQIAQMPVPMPLDLWHLCNLWILIGRDR